MPYVDEPSLAVAEMVLDARAAADAALRRDFDESRFRAHLIMGKAYALGLMSVAIAAAVLESDFGPPGSEPGDNYAASMVRVAEELKGACQASQAASATDTRFL